MPPKRYFDDERSAKPGTISDQLRAAINLHDDKLPMWIYKMRVLGYPPGWLQQADISSSSLELFDDSSQAHQSTSSKVKEQAFNPECFVEFPGFNAPVPVGVRDHCEILGMPPMQGFQQLKFVKQSIPPPKPVPYKRIKMSRNGSDCNIETSAIDVEDDDEIQIIEPTESTKKLAIKIRDTEKEEGEATDSDDDIITISSSIYDQGPKTSANSSVLNTSTTVIEQYPQSPNSDSILLVSPSSSKPDSNLPSTSFSSQSPIAFDPNQPSTSSQAFIELDKNQPSTPSQSLIELEQNQPSTSSRFTSSSSSDRDSDKPTTSSQFLNISSSNQPSTSSQSTVELEQDQPSTSSQIPTQSVADSDLNQPSSSTLIANVPNVGSTEEKSAKTGTATEVQNKEKQSSAQPNQPQPSSSSVQAPSPSMKLIGMGCPLPADISSKKPPLENFAVGMGELIYFENLPTSTGVFDKMRNVISKVRKKLSG